MSSFNRKQILFYRTCLLLVLILTGVVQSNASKKQITSSIAGWGYSEGEKVTRVELGDFTVSFTNTTYHSSGLSVGGSITVTSNSGSYIPSIFKTNSQSYTLIDGTYTLPSQVAPPSLPDGGAEQTVTIYYYEGTTVGGLIYDLDESGTTLVGVANNSGSLIVDTTVEYDGKTYPLTNVDICSGAGDITEIQIKDSEELLTLGDCMFGGAEPQTVYVGRKLSNTSVLFQENQKLSTVVLGDQYTTIQENTFSGSTLTSIKAPAVKTIGDDAFYGCLNLVSVEFSDELKSIGNSAFSFCFELSYIDFTETLEEIGTNAFYLCSSLSGLLSIPKGITKIPENAFASTAYTICEVSGDTLIELIEEEPIEDPDIDSVQERNNPLGNVETVIVPSNMASVYRSANWGELYTIVSNSGTEVSVEVTTPGNLANDIVTQTRKAPASVNKLIITGGEMNDDDFRVIKDNMTACFDLDLSAATCESIPEGALKGKNVLRSIILPDNATKIGENAFADCPILESVSVNENGSLETIGANAFANCMSLKTANVGGKVTEIGSCAFAYVRSLKNIKMSAALTTVGESAFNYATNLQSISFGDNVETIGSNAFYGCTSLTDVSFGNSPAAIGNSAFSGCTSLSILSFSDAISSIGSEAFMECSSLKNVVLPNSITSINGMTFQDCTSLNSIVLPDALSSIGADAFNGCSALSNIDVPATVNSIGASAFSNSGLVSVDLSELDGMTAIETETFFGCDKLESVAFPQNITSVGDNAFLSCISLTDADMSETKVSKVGANAFNGCAKLASIFLPTTTKELGESAFSGCRKLQTISITAMTPPTVQSTTFKSVSNETCSLLIPTKAFSDYILASYWGSFVDIKASFDIEIEGDEAGLDYEVFDNEEDANEDVSGDNSDNENIGDAENVDVRRKSHTLAKANSNNLSNGISLFVPSSKTVRFHVTGNMASGEVLVFLNDEDVTDRLVNGYLILSNFGDVNTIKVKSPESGIKDVTNTDGEINANTIVDVYNLSGVVVMRGVEMGSIGNLSAGIYIARSANATKKIVIK